jgi:hypothetical protein
MTSFKILLSIVFSDTFTLIYFNFNLVYDYDNNNNKQPTMII